MAHYVGEKFLPTSRHDTYPAIDPSKADLTGKVVVITGASRGIGQTTAIAVAQAGAKGIALLARGNLGATKSECLQVAREGHKPEVLALSVDVMDTAQVNAAAKRIVETFARVDIVINNAGYLEQYALVADSEPAEWWKSFEINLRGTYAVTRALLPLLIASAGDKTIVNVASAGALGFLPRFSAYTIAKLAQLRLAEWVSGEYGDKGVLAYSVHPGVIGTEMSTRLPPEFQAPDFLTDTTQLAAHTLLWLVRERREWLAGRFVDARWDVEALLAKKQEVIEGDKLKINLVV